MPENIEIVWPAILLLIPVPFLVRFLLPAYSTGSDTLWLPLISDYRKASLDQGSGRNYWLLILATLAWLLLLLSASRPQLAVKQPGLPINGRDMMLAIDLSESMRQTDFEYRGKIVNRLEASKYVASDFIAGRTGDRIGLIVFGTQAYLHTPLTLDRKTVRILLNETSIGLAGSKTAIGDAIGLAVKRLKDTDAEQRVLILVTDGANTAGEVQPQVAARLAASSDMRIYTIGIGSQEGIIDNELQKSFMSNTYGLDERMLRHIAGLTGGKYFLASDTGMLVDIYNEIDKLEPVIISGEQLFLHKELYPWPLACALGMLLIGRIFIRRRYA
ncbi:MAG: VWA domain-containing protein [Thiotrichales bacterium]|nr:VWA domain-containing protein [Thiotrichales bacterium]